MCDIMLLKVLRTFYCCRQLGYDVPPQCACAVPQSRVHYGYGRGVQDDMSGSLCAEGLPRDIGHRATFIYIRVPALAEACHMCVYIRQLLIYIYV